MSLCRLPLFLFAFFLFLPAAAFAHSSREALDWAGTYKGILPCADCEGIEQTLILQPDGHYQLVSLYLGQEDGAEQESGLFVWDPAGAVITLRETGGKYQVGENKLIRLDLSGEPVAGALAARYNLVKQPPKGLIETYWKLVELRGLPVLPSQSKAHIILKDKENRVIGSSGCNSLTGLYELKEPNRLDFTKLAGTMMACVDGMENERAFLDVLDQTDSYSLKDGRLQLFRARMAPLAVFEAIYLN